MQGFLDVVADKGYAAATIADIVAAARVSKRTFYEHFADKEDCLLATYQQSSERLLELLRAAGATGAQLPWRDRVGALTRAYLTALDALPPVHRTLMLEIQVAGPRAFALRTRTQSRFAALMCELVQEASVGEPEIRPISPELALALVGGINELMLHVFNPYSAHASKPFTALTETVTQLATAVISRPE
jgi:AcrR family transcriptional regulator